jgi:hypothetical protein
LTKCRVVGKQGSTHSTWLKIDPGLQFCSKNSPQKIQIDTDIFDGVMTSSFFGGMTSYPTIFRKYTSADPISVKIGTIVHFDDKSSPKKIQHDSDIYDVVMTSSVFADDVISDDFDDVITTSKMSESF